MYLHAPKKKNMWKTVLLLIVTLVIVPFAGFYFGDPLTDKQWITVKELVIIYLISAITCFVISTLTKNYSQVDKLWSVIPVAYVWIVCFRGDFEPRLILMSVVVTIWAIRLTYNFSRRGGYSWKFWTGDEDYRWAILQAKPEFSNPIVWGIFNLLFISLYQMALILLFTFPIVKAMGSGPIGIWDWVCAAGILFFVITETIADQQQWNYQKEKHRRINAGEDLGGFYGKGFTHTGLWSLVRHPNYTSEQAIWIVFYFFSVAATGSWLNWSVVGCSLLLVLFKSSSDFSENVTAEKYPEYTAYQKRVPRFVPFTKFGK